MADPEGTPPEVEETPPEVEETPPEVEETVEVEETEEVLEVITEEEEEEIGEKTKVGDGGGSKKQTKKKPVFKTKKTAPPKGKKKKKDAGSGAKGKKGKGKKKKGSIIWGRKPLPAVLSFPPCPHIYFKKKIEDRSKLKKADYLNLLATPKRGPWEDLLKGDPELVPYRRRQLTTRTTCLAIPKKIYVKAILEEYSEILNETQKDKLTGILQTECDLTKENLELKTGTKEERPGSSKSKKSDNKGIGASKKTPRPKSPQTKTNTKPEAPLTKQTADASNIDENKDEKPDSSQLVENRTGSEEFKEGDNTPQGSQEYFDAKSQ